MTDTALRDVATELFDRFSGWEMVEEAERCGWAEPLWKALQDVGFGDVPVPEELGGAGGDIADAITLLRVAGAHAAAVPLAEAGLVGGWLLSSVRLGLPDGVRTVLPPVAQSDLHVDAGRLFGTVPAVPWGHRAEHVVGIVEGAVILAPGPAAGVAELSVTRTLNLANEARDTLCFDGVPVTERIVAPDGIDHETLWQRIALGRAALMSGALDAVAAMTLRYSSEREQFGRPIGQFQAVQAHLVALHQQAVAASAAVDGAVEAVARGRGGGFEIACAKILVDRAAQLAARAAHQTHGAIGMTQEYPLHYLTRRILAWRDEAGGHHRWVDRLGAAVVAAGPDALYPAIQAGSEVIK
jgi:acyl-CoA dehydrogenase